MIRGSTEVNSRNATVPPGNNGTPPSHRTGPETGRERRNGSSAARNDQPMPEDEMHDGEMPEKTGSIGLSSSSTYTKTRLPGRLPRPTRPGTGRGSPGRTNPCPASSEGPWERRSTPYGARP